MENKVLAIVNGKKITQFAVDQFIRSMGPERGAQLSNPEGEKRVLDELINQNLYLADAMDNEIEETAEFKNEMQRMKEVILTQVNINSTMRGIGIVESEVKDYFEQNQAKYNQPASANTSHILVEDEAECAKLREKIMKKEIDFAEAAKQYSKCPSGQKGGELGLHPRGQMVPEYDAVSFAMEIGEISQPVKTQFGYHLIKLNEKTEGKSVQYEEVKNQVATELQRKKQNEAYFNKLQELKSKYKVEIM